MTLNSYLGTIEWNEVRGLTKTLNLKLENDMVEEEKKEFYDDYAKFKALPKGDEKVDAIVGMVDALCDYTFVAVGTDSKAALNVLSLNDKVVLQALKDDMEKQISLMTTIITHILGNYLDLDACYGYVLEQNNKKPNKQDVNGKNTKGDVWEDPKHMIKAHIMTLPIISEYIDLPEKASEASVKGKQK